MVTLTRGSKKTESIFFSFWYEKCSWYDFILCAFYLVACAFGTIISVKMINYEQKFKIKFNKGICKSDLKFSSVIVRRLILVAFAGGWISGALGLGGGAIFNPVLLSMGIPPAVSSSTGMYLVMFTTLGSSITYFLNGTMNIEYSLWTGAWCILGSFAGMKLLEKVMKKWNRQSPIVFILALILGLSSLIIPVFGAIDLIEKTNLGQKIFAFKTDDICPNHK